LIPSSEDGWPVACAALKHTGGFLHIHSNVETKMKNMEKCENVDLENELEANRWSTITKKQTIASHLKPLRTKKIRRYGIGNLGLDLRQAQNYGGVKTING
jgi:tRNA G37 N-methylase Trm5